MGEGRRGGRERENSVRTTLEIELDSCKGLQDLLGFLEVPDARVLALAFLLKR